jgi:hypothetical protein
MGKREAKFNTYGFSSMADNVVWLTEYFHHYLLYPRSGCYVAADDTANRKFIA